MVKILVCSLCGCQSLKGFYVKLDSMLYSGVPVVKSKCPACGIAREIHSPVMHQSLTVTFGERVRSVEENKVRWAYDVIAEHYNRRPSR